MKHCPDCRGTVTAIELYKDRFGVHYQCPRCSHQWAEKEDQ